MIPKIIHQTWKNENIPEAYRAFQEKVRALHPDWEYKLWTDADNLALVEQHFPDFLPVYLGFPENIMRADVIRYLIMHRMGGVYLDLDYEMLKPFDLLAYDLVLPYNRDIPSGDTCNALGNCIFASCPGHDFWTLAIDDLKQITDYQAFFKSLTNKPYITKQTTLVEAITGPGFLTRIFYEHEKELEKYILPERSLFHPLNTGGSKAHFKLMEAGRAYGIHHCYGSWRNKSIFKRAVSKIKRLLKTK